MKLDIDQKSVDKVINLVSDRDIIVQSIEEASEWIQALSKLLRYLDGENLPNCSLYDIINALNEELADNMLCQHFVMNVLGYCSPVRVNANVNTKLERWGVRLTEITPLTRRQREWKGYFRNEETNELAQAYREADS